VEERITLKISFSVQPEISLRCRMKTDADAVSLL